MIKILIKTDSHYKVNRKRLRKIIETFLAEKKLKTAAEISITVIGDRQMKKLNNDFRKINATTDVLAFPLINARAPSKFVDPPDGVLRLGDIILSYPQVIEGAREDDMLVDDKIDQLVIHALKNLIGIGE